MFQIESINLERGVSSAVQDHRDGGKKLKYSEPVDIPWGGKLFSLITKLRPGQEVVGNSLFRLWKRLLRAESKVSLYLSYTFPLKVLVF